MSERCPSDGGLSKRGITLPGSDTIETGGSAHCTAGMTKHLPRDCDRGCTRARFVDIWTLVLRWLRSKWAAFLFWVR